MAPLNPEAADYVPHHHHHHHHQIIMLPPYYPTSHQQYRLFFKLSSTQHLVFYYYPHTTTELPFSLQTHHHHLTTAHVSPPHQPVRFCSKPLQQLDGNNNNNKQAFLHRRLRQPRYARRIQGREEDHQRQKMRWRVRPDPTTVMIKNIPSKYTRDMLIAFLDRYCMRENAGSGNMMIAAFDCVYLPIDFKTGFNKGYAFVNFTNSKTASKFTNAISYQKWDFFQSQKIRVVVPAHLQGKENLAKHFGEMCFPCHSQEVLPVFFYPPRDGTLKGEPRTVGRLILKPRRM